MSSELLSITYSTACYVGFDVSKDKLDWSLITYQGIEETHGVVPNDVASITELLLTLGGHYVDVDLRPVVEATGTYHQPLLEAATAIGLPVRVFNPIITKQQIRSTVRARKTDRTDAFLIARVGWSGEGRIYTPEPYLATKHFARSCQKLSELAVSFKVYQGHITGQLEDVLSPEAGILLLGVQKAISDAKKQLYKELTMSARGQDFRVLQTVPGIGPFIAASLIGEIQDVRRFPSHRHLVAFMGLEPRNRQSGKSLNTKGTISKRGSSYLRRSMFIAANVARQHDPQFGAYYDKKRGEGKTYTEAVCAVARKLVTVLYAVWTNSKSYEVPAIWREPQ